MIKFVAGKKSIDAKRESIDTVDDSTDLRSVSRKSWITSNAKKDHILLN
jgi:hypothetical protein